MFTAELFLGLPVEGELAQALDRVDPRIAAVFIGGDDHYLKEAVCQGIRYLGKFAGPIHDTAGLDLMEKNIYSLLKKIIPEFSFESAPLLLFPVEHE